MRYITIEYDYFYETDHAGTPKEVKVNVEIKYDGNNKRPSEFIVEYEINGRYG
ncbi:DNA/RNA non-specific endonuclease [Priestia megaterium]|jgi:hypothetical protein